MRWFFLLLLGFESVLLRLAPAAGTSAGKGGGVFSLYQGARQNIRLVSETDVARILCGVESGGG